MKKAIVLMVLALAWTTFVVSANEVPPFQIEKVGKLTPSAVDHLHPGSAVSSQSPNYPPYPLNQGRVSTSPNRASDTWLGGWGTGGNTSGHSYWYLYYARGAYETINWRILCTNPSTDYDLYLYNGNGNPGQLLASATRTTYPDTLRYTISGINLVMLEVRYYSGPTSGIFSLENIRRPTTQSNYMYVMWGLEGQGGSPYTDGIEGYNPYASSEPSHWFNLYVPTNWNNRWFRYQITNAAAGDYDLYVYDSNGNQVAYADGTSYPDITTWIDGHVYAGQYLYLEVDAFSRTNAEYRVDFGGQTGVEEQEGNNGKYFHSNPTFKVAPNPTPSHMTLYLTSPKAANAKITVFDIMGSLVGSLEIPTNQPTTWDGRGNDGRKLPAGVYFLRATSGDFTATEKVVITR
jgi:hypothetical protein